MIKKIFFTLLFCLVTIFSFGQSSEHLKFMGIPIDGTPIEFSKKLKEKGFTYIGVDESKGITENTVLKIMMEDGTIFCEGNFATYDCNVVIKSEYNKAYAVYVIFKKCDKSDFEKLRKLFYDKYYQNDNNYKSEIKMDSYLIGNNNSMINVLLTSKGNVAILYTDGINASYIENKKNEQINNDI